MNAGSLTGHFAVAEGIAARDLNNLYLTSCYFEDRERYRSFCALYAVMRVVDDRIDTIPSRTGLSDEERRREHEIVDGWSELFESGAAAGELAASFEEVAARCDFDQAGELLTASAEAMHRFPVPMELWRNFFSAMHLDLNQARFERYTDFLEYAEGATVAPTTIYLYLIAAEPDAEGVYRLPPGFDLIGCGRQLGLFAYLAHILRDLAFDLSTGDEGLLYLARDDMERHGVTEESLFSDLERKEAGPRLRALVADLVGRAKEAAAEGRRLAQPLSDSLSRDCTFILELIITMYERVLGKIVECAYDPLQDAHHLTMEEKTSLAREVGERVGLSEVALPVAPAG